MTPRDGLHGWLSAHLYFRGELFGPDGDRVALEVIEPFLERLRRDGWNDRYFFVRYRDLAPHLRFRIHGLMQVLEGRVRPALVRHVQTVWPDVSIQDAALPQDGEARAQQALRWVAYKPEMERYGGVAGVEIAERSFQVSSCTALALLHKVNGADRDLRLGKALLAMLVGVHVFVGSAQRATEFAAQYRTSHLWMFAQKEGQPMSWPATFDDGYSRQAKALTDYIEDVWTRLSEADALSPELDDYRDALARARDDLDRLCARGRLLQRGQPQMTFARSVRVLLPSYVHMMNNRLGVTVAEEAYLAHLITRGLRDGS